MFYRILITLNLFGYNLPKFPNIPTHPLKLIHTRNPILISQYLPFNKITIFLFIHLFLFLYLQHGIL